MWVFFLNTQYSVLNTFIFKLFPFSLLSKAEFVRRNYKVLFIRILLVHLFKIAKKGYYEKRISTQTNHVALLFPGLLNGSTFL